MHRSRLGMCAAAGFALVALACGRNDADYGMDDTGVRDTLTSPGDVDLTPGSLRVADIMDNPTRYVGDTVTVEADVEEVLGTFAFVLDEDDVLAGGFDNDIIVFSPRSAQLSDIDDRWLNNRVRVTGTVRLMTVVELERELDWDLTPELEADIKANRPVLIAHHFERVGTR